MSEDHWVFRETAAAMLRMKRAHDRGTGCTLTADMLAAMYATGWGERWNQVHLEQQPAQAPSPPSQQ
jgi:hypothetical protein